MHMTSARLRFLATGAFRLDGGGMFGLIPKTMWSKWTEADADNRIALATRSLLVETRDGLVLVEAGCGDKWSEKERATYALEPRTAVDALGEIGGEDPVEQSLRRQAHEIGIGDMGIADRVSEPARFQFEMKPFGA